MAITSPFFMRSYPKISISVTALFLALVLSACGGTDANSPESLQTKLQELKAQRSQLDAEIRTVEGQLSTLTAGSRQTKRVLVEALKPSRQDFAHFVKIQGRVESELSLNVAPQASGRYTRILVKKGQMVKAGEVLAEVDASILKTQLAELRSQISLAEVTYSKQKSLWDQGIGTEIQYLQAKTNFQLLQDRLATLNEQLALYRVTAPVSGVIDEVIPREGELANPAMPLCRLVNNSKLRAVADIPESYQATVRVGDPVRLTFPDLNLEMEAKVTALGNQIDAVNRTFSVEVSLPANNALRNNMLVFMELRDYFVPKALVIPVNIVQAGENNQRTVYAIAGQGDQITARRTVVELGKVQGGLVEVLAGLKENDLVVTTGFQNLTDGQAVQLTQ